jgi:hypothetical protein
VTPFCLEREFRATPARFWAVFFDRAYLAMVWQHARLRESEILDWRDDGATIRRRIRMIPHRELPLVIRKLTGATLEYIEESVFHRAENRVDIRVVPTLLTDRVLIAAEYKVTACAPDRLLRTFAGTISVNVPIVGKTIEKLVIDDVAKSYAEAAEVTDGWLDGSLP